MKRRPFVHTYSKLDAMMASPTEPMPQAKRDYQLTIIYEGLRAIERDPAPKADHWRAVCDAINYTETLIRMGHASDGSGLLQDATRAMALAGRRHYQEKKPLRLDGPGVQAVRAVLEDYAYILANVPHRVAITCVRETETRIHELRTGKRREHDVEIVDL